MHELVLPLIEVIDMLIELFKFAVILAIVLSWLVMFNVINTRNRAVYMIMDTVNRITEPALRRIRRVMPNTGALDLSPIVLFVLLYLIQSYLAVVARNL